jgi:cobalt/nickel transport system ATP-binding protein
VVEDVAFGPRNMGFAEDEVMRRVSEALDKVEMAEDAARNIHHLSYGQKKRVCIAGLLAMGHEILLLDEPTAGLDPVGELRMMELLLKLNRSSGVTIVMATHSVDLVPLFLGKVHVLGKGRLVSSGSAAEIFRTPAGMEAVRLRLPHVAELFWQLQQDGFPLNSLPLTSGEARQELAKILGKRNP